ncbi:TlpA family protein disulfide reductase [Streptomyces sp. NPDC001070]
MPFVVAGLVLVGILAALNLGLIIVILRRWQELEAVARTVRAPGEVAGPVVGDRLPAIDADGPLARLLAPAGTAGEETFLGFFSLDCGSCVEALPHFAEYAERVASRGGRTLAVLRGEDAAGSELAGRLGDIAAEVVTEDLTARLSGAFGVRRFPTFVHYDADGFAILAGAGYPALQGYPAAV